MATSMLYPFPSSTILKSTVPANIRIKATITNLAPVTDDAVRLLMHGKDILQLREHSHKFRQRLTRPNRNLQS